MLIKNVNIYTAEHGFSAGDLLIRDQRIVINTAEEPERQSELSGLLLPDEEIIDASGLMALPGLVDLHFHGAVGHDFCDADFDGLQAIAKYEAECGVLAICPATMAVSEAQLNEIVDAAGSYEFSMNLQKNNSRLSEEGRADLVGIYLEGPFLSPEKAGAQDPSAMISADPALFRRLQRRCGGLIKICVVAPEVPGNMDFIREMKDQVRISLGHTVTDYDTAMEAYKEGAKELTHLFNAMPGLSHRMPGPIPAALDSGADAELIADGIHVHPSMVRLGFRMFGAEHLILISDSMEATGCPDGDYTLGGTPVTVCGKKAVLTEDSGTIAGSVTNLYDCMKTAVLEMGIPLPDAVRAASENPARALGIDRDYGSLHAGSYANVILADQALNRHRIIQKGKTIRLGEQAV